MVPAGKTFPASLTVSAVPEGEEGSLHTEGDPEKQAIAAATSTGSDAEAAVSRRLLLHDGKVVAGMTMGFAVHGA